MGRRPTIQMIAEKAGVSRGTVDRVVNNRSYVKSEVRERVLSVMREVGYVPAGQTYSAGAGENPFHPVKLGVLLPNWVGHFKTEVLRGVRAARDELTDFQVEVTLAECQTDIPGEVIELLDRLVEGGAQGIAMCALDDVSITAKVDALAALGIPVITFNSDLPESRRLCFVGQDYTRSGRIAAELMCKCIASDAQVLACVGNLEFNGHRSRLDGFCARMRERGFGADQITVIETFNDYHTTYRKVSEALTRTPGLAAVYMANQSVAGCAEAVQAANRRGEIRVICHDVSESTKRLLRDGGVDLAISQDMYRQGYQPLVLLRELLQKGKVPAPDPGSANISIFCAENL